MKISKFSIELAGLVGLALGGSIAFGVGGMIFAVGLWMTIVARDDA